MKDRPKTQSEVGTHTWARRFFVGFWLVVLVLLGLALFFHHRATSRKPVPTASSRPAPSAGFDDELPRVASSERPELIFVLPFDHPLECYVGGPLLMRQLGRKEGPAFNSGMRIIDGVSYHESVFAGLTEPLENETARLVELLSRGDEKERRIDIRVNTKIPVQIVSRKRFSIRLIDLDRQQEIIAPFVVAAGRYHLTMLQVVSPEEAALLPVQLWYKDIWGRDKERIHTLEATAVNRSLSAKPEDESFNEYRVRIDFPAGLYTCRQADYERPGGRCLHEAHVGRTAGHLWFAEGAGRYTLIPDTPDNAEDSRIVLDGALSLIQRAYLPAHLTFKTPVEMALIGKVQSNSVRNAEILHFETCIGTLQPRDIIYEVQADEYGTRIHEMRHGVGDRLLWRITNSGFRLVDGVWVASRMQFEDLALSSSPENQSKETKQGHVLDVVSIRFNKEFTSADFEPPFKTGDTVDDQVNKRRYTCGDPSTQPSR